MNNEYLRKNTPLNFSDHIVDESDIAYSYSDTDALPVNLDVSEAEQDIVMDETMVEEQRRLLLGIHTAQDSRIVKEYEDRARRLAELGRLDPYSLEVILNSADIKKAELFNT